jgi:putative PIN family toxin of toxin-antitoxin system
VAPRIVLDTNVLIAAIRSRKGASFKLLSLVGKGHFETVLSVPLALEYEDALLRHAAAAGLTAVDVEAIVDYLCKVSVLQPVFFLWRPLLPDPNDDMVAEVAIAASCDFIVTFNARDFGPVRQFKVRIVTPKALLSNIGVLP